VRGSLEMQDPKNRQKVAIRTPSHNFVGLSSHLRHILTIGKNLLSSSVSSTCSHNMVNFNPLAAEILSLVWGTPANFNGFRVLAALLHGTLLVASGRKPNFAALNRGRHLYSAGRPSRWALVHILVCYNLKAVHTGCAAERCIHTRVV